MRRSISVLIILLLLTSCKLTDERPEEKVTAIGEEKEAMKAIDKDEHGCLASAGYIWSKANKECIKIFTGVQLNPIDKPDNEDETISTFLMFSEDHAVAEIFMPKATESLLLQKSTQNQWSNDEFTLIQKDGFVLYKEQKPIFKGEDFIGKKVLDTDTEGK